MARILAWPTKAQATPRPLGPPQHMWTMVKGQWQIHCILEEGGRLGWAVQVLMNGAWIFRCEFRTWDAAIAAAENKYAELSDAGWMPVPISSSGGPNA